MRIVGFSENSDVLHFLQKIGRISGFWQNLVCFSKISDFDGKRFPWEP